MMPSEELQTWIDNRHRRTSVTTYHYEFEMHMFGSDCSPQVRSCSRMVAEVCQPLAAVDVPDWLGAGAILRNGDYRLRIVEVAPEMCLVEPVGETGRWAVETDVLVRWWVREGA